MNNTLLAVIGGALLLGLLVLGITSWGWGNANGASVPMSGAVAQGQAYYNMGPGMMGGQGLMGSMMQGWSMGPWAGMSNTYGWGCGTGGMHGSMMGLWSSMGHMRDGMMGGWGHCGGMQTHAPVTPQSPTVATTSAVELSQLAFNPSIIRVRKGTMVTWTNRDSVPHTVTASDGSFRSGLLNPGQTWSFTFDKPGTYSYYCEPHPFMQGQVIVEDEAGK